MGNDKHTGTSAKAKDLNTGSSGEYSAENPSDSTAPLDGSDFSWLVEEKLDYVNNAELYRKCRVIVDKVNEEGLDYGHFNWALNYGNMHTESRKDKVLQRARSQFRGEYLIPMLHNVRIPPRTESKGARTEGAKESIDKFALSLTAQRLREEMRDFEDDYDSIKPEALSQQDGLKNLNFDALEARVHALCPALFILLFMLSTCIYRKHRWGSNKQDAGFFVVMIICAMAHQLSSHNNAFQRLLGYYFKAKRVPKAVIDLLSHLNLSTSYRSVTSTLSTLSESIHKTTLEAVQALPFLIVHDNLRIKQAVRSQRHDRQTVTDNGTAMTVLILPESSRPAWEDPEAVRALQSHIERQRALGTPLRVTARDLLDSQRQERVLAHKLGHMFDILRAIPCMKGIATSGDCPPSTRLL